MKKLLLLATMFAVVLSVNAQRRMQVWEGNTYMQFFITDVDSVTFLPFPEGILQECEEIHDTVILTMRDTVYVKDTVYINKCNPEGQGVFSVSADKQVSFAKGNLLYQASTNKWCFANNQYDYIGSDNANISDTYTGWIDLFGWGTGNNPTNTSTTYNVYQTFVDWGTNTIGTDAPNTWRTPACEEWYYIFYARANAQKLFGLGKVNGVNGTIILPDNWIAPVGITFTPSTEKGLADQGGYFYDDNVNSHWSDNTYTLSDWQQMENAGAVFLPAAGGRSVYGVSDVQKDGYYWSSTVYDGTDAYRLSFRSYRFYTRSNNSRCSGFSVRLVQDL